ACVAGNQSAVGNDVDQARYALRGLVNSAQSVGGKRAAVGAAHVQTVPDIGFGFAFVERVQVIARRDPLRQLSKLRPRQQIAQLGLADEKDLQQLVGGRLQIGQQSDLLEPFAAHVLGLVDDQHHSL